MWGFKKQGSLLMFDVPNYWLNVELRGLRFPRVRFGRTLYRRKLKGEK
jgi:hypothetical protein